jgi:hypothetical protein
MAEDLNIPDELKGTFKRLMYRVPREHRGDSHAQKIIQLYLKLGGEKLAKQYIEIIKLHVREKKRQDDAAVKTSEESDMETQSSDPDSSESESLGFPFM